MKITVNHPGNSVLIGALIPVGSRYEGETYKGISHFLEHMLFKGTKNLSGKEITAKVEKFGALFNAYTSEECTFYHIKIAREYVNIARNVIDDMVHNSILPNDELLKERDVVLQELQMYQDNPQSAVFELANKHIFELTSGLNIPIIGTTESLARINRKVMEKHYKKYYKNPVMIEVGSGYDFNNFKPIPEFGEKFKVEAQIKNTSDMLYNRAGITQSNMIITGLIDLNPNVIENEYSLKLFSACMNGFTGRLFQTIREKHNMVYHVSFGYQIFSCGTAQYYVYAALDQKNITKAKSLILNELKRPLTEFEIEFAMNKWIGQYNLSKDDIDVTTRNIVNSIVRNQYFDTYNAIDNIQWSAQKVRRFQDKLTQTNKKLIAIVPEK